MAIVKISRKVFKLVTDVLKMRQNQYRCYFKFNPRHEKEQPDAPLELDDVDILILNPFKSA